MLNVEQRAWVVKGLELARDRKFDELVEHVRLSVNTSKEILLSVDPEVQREIEDLRKEVNHA